VTNPGQENSDSDSMGDACDTDGCDAIVDDELETTSDLYPSSFETARVICKGIEIRGHVYTGGDKDIFLIAQALKDEKWFDFLKLQLEERKKRHG
jgi:hypothetical protein